MSSFLEIIEKTNNDNNELFHKSRPKHIISGFFYGLGNITLGVVSGFVGLISYPIIHCYSHGKKEFLKGLGIGILLFILLPLGGTIMGLSSILKGIYNTPSIIYNKKMGKVWDNYMNKWIYYSIENEKQFINSKNEGDFVNLEIDEVKEMDLYNILDVTPNSSDEEIKKKYRKYALKYHPDKNNGKEDEMFKKINEAYKILSNKELRDKYNKLGKEGLLDISLSDSKQLYMSLFGSDVLHFYIGDLNIYTLMVIDSNNINLIKLKQIKRELIVTDNLIELLNNYLKHDNKITFCKHINKNIIHNALGGYLVTFIGNLYIELGNSYLSSISSFTRIIRSNFRLIKYKWNIITNNFSKDDDKLSKIVLNVILEDIENTITNSCKKLFFDYTIDSKKKEDYALALKYIGEFLRQNKYKLKDVINIIKEIL